MLDLKVSDAYARAKHVLDFVHLTLLIVLRPVSVEKSVGIRFSYALVVHGRNGESVSFWTFVIEQ